MAKEHAIILFLMTLVALFHIAHILVLPKDDDDNT